MEYSSRPGLQTFFLLSSFFEPLCKRMRNSISSGTFGGSFCPPPLPVIANGLYSPHSRPTSPTSRGHTQVSGFAQTVPKWPQSPGATPPEWQVRSLYLASFPISLSPSLHCLSQVREEKGVIVTPMSTLPPSRIPRIHRSVRCNSSFYFFLFPFPHPPQQFNAKKVAVKFARSPEVTLPVLRDGL